MSQIDDEVRRTGARGFLFGTDSDGQIRFAFVENGIRTFDPGPISRETAVAIMLGLAEAIERLDARAS